MMLNHYRQSAKDIMRDMATGRNIGHKLQFNPNDKTVKPVPVNPRSSRSSINPDGSLNMHRSDADLYGGT